MEGKIVSLSVAKLLKGRFGFDLPTLYVYDHGEKKFSLERCNDPIPAPTIMEAVNYLWELGIKIYVIPEGELARGVVSVGERKVGMRCLTEVPIESYEKCLEFLSVGGH